MTKDVFISHSSKDSELANEICKLLEDRGINCWIAPRDIVPGKKYAVEIIDAIKSTHATVLVLSENSNKSDQVENEIGRAVNYGKIIYPFRIRNIEPSKTIELYTSNAQWIDAWKPPIEQKIDQLADAISALTGKTPSPKRVNTISEDKPSSRNYKKKVIAAIAGIGILIVALMIIFLWQKRQNVINAELAKYVVQIRDVPLSANIYKNDLKALIEKVEFDSDYQDRYPQTVALLYRLYAASILISPAGQSEVATMRNGLIWLQKSIELVPSHIKWVTQLYYSPIYL